MMNDEVFELNGEIGNLLNLMNVYYIESFPDLRDIKDEYNKQIALSSLSNFKDTLQEAFENMIEVTNLVEELEDD